MGTRQTAIPFKRLREANSGKMVELILRGAGLDPQGDIHKYVDKENERIIYTERVNERPEKVGTISALDGGI